MADVNKTVSITYSANVGPLERGLRNIPNTTRKEMRTAIKAVDQQLKRAGKAAERTAKRMRASFKKAGAGIAAVGAGIATAGAGVLAFGQQLADLTNDLVDTSTKTGLAVETLEGLRVAAEGSGLAFEQFIGPLQRIQFHMVEANKGTKLSSELFSDMGVSVTDTNGALRTADDVFRQMMTNLGNISNPLERNALLMKAFGESGAMFAQAGVVGALEDFVSLAGKFGVETGPAAVDQAAQFQRAMADLQIVGTGAMESILMTMTGSDGLASAIDSITEGVIFLEAGFKTAFAAITFPIKVAVGELNALGFALTGDFDKAREAMRIMRVEGDKELAKLTNSFNEANDKINALRKARRNIRGGGSTNEPTPRRGGANTGETNAKKEAKAVKELTEERRTDLDAIKEIIRAQETLSEHIAEFSRVNETQEQIIRRAHHERVEQYKKEIDAVNKRYGDEYVALLELYENKQITEEEGMARLKAIEAETYAAIDLMRSAEMSSQRRMYEELDALSEANAAAEIERRKEVAAAVRQSFTDMAFSVADSITTIQSNEIDRLTKQMDDSIAIINEQEEAGLLSSREAAKAREKIESSHMESIQQQQMKVYNIKKATAVAQILIDAATAAARAFADYPYPASLGVAALAGAGAFAQIKAVDSTPPPTFDMGGMIGNNDLRRPDERFVRALEGEAILDRATVQSLGGEAGVRSLQNGNGGGGVVVVQPFKHFDRFIRSRQRKRTNKTGRGGY